MKLFSGTNNSQLAHKVARLLNFSLAKAEIIRFEDSEIRVRIEENVSNQDAVVIQSTANPADESYMELFFFSDALRREKAKKVIGVIPYLGYARQNIQHRPGEAVSINVVIKFLEEVGFDEIYTFDIHDEATLGIFSIPVKHQTALPLLAENIKKYLQKKNIDNKDFAIVSPDQAGVERARVFSKAFFGKKNVDIVVVEKKRDLTKIHETKAVAIYGDVSSKTAVLVDDIVTSGNTLINASKLCLEKGAKKVIAAVTHHDFSEKAPKKIQNSAIEKFFTTDTIFLKDGQKFEKLEEISITPLIAKELKKIT